MDHTHESVRHLAATLAVMFVALLLAPRVTQASGVVGNGTPQSCTEAALDAALIDGGPVTFNCGPSEHTIAVSHTKDIAADTSLDGGNLISLSGGEAVRVLSVNPGAHLSLANLTVRDGRALSGSGAGVANHGRLTVLHSAFMFNHADAHGGAILNYGTAAITESYFDSNQAGINGGAIDTTVTLVVSDTVFVNNTARYRGGAVNNYLGSLTLFRSSFRQNSSGGYGGGVVNDGGTAEILATGFYTNTAQSVGGGIRNAGSLMTLTDSTLAGNTATEGAGIANIGTLNILNSTITHNMAASEGAGINNEAGAVLDLWYVTLVANANDITGASAGNLANAGAATVRASLLVDGYPDNCAQLSHTPITSQGYNVESSNDCGFTAEGDLQLTHPLLGALADNGGPTLTHTYLPASAGLDTIPADRCPSADQRGLTRPQGTYCDMGALELLVSPPVPFLATRLPWQMEAHDALRSGQGNAPGPDDARLAGTPWPFQANNRGERLSTSPAIDYSGTAFLGSTTGILYAVNAMGGVNFKYRANGSIHSSPALLSEGLPQPPGDDGTWIPSLAGAVYFGADDGKLYALDSLSGAARWSLAPGGEIAAPLRSPVTAYKPLGKTLARTFVGSQSGLFYAVFEDSPTSAHTAWEIVTGASVTTAAALSPDGSIIYLGGGDGRLYCIDVKSGQLLDRKPPRDLASGPLTSPTIDKDGNIFLGAAAGRLFSFDRLCNPTRPYWQISLSEPVRAAPVLSVDGRLVVIAGNTLIGFDRFATQIWTQTFGSHPLGAIAPIVSSTGVVYVLSADGWLFAVDPATGAILWLVQVVDASPFPFLPSLEPPGMDGNGRIFLAAGQFLQVIDDKPAYQLALQGDLQAPASLDIYSLRESYGAVDPTRTLRLTSHPQADRQPAYGLDRSRLTYVIDQFLHPDVYLANAAAAGEVSLTAPQPGAPFTSASNEIEPAFSAVDDRNGASRLPNGRRYVAFTTDSATTVAHLLFRDLRRYEVGGLQLLSFTAWATAQGVPLAVAQDTEPPQTQQSQVAFSPDGTRVAWRHCDLNRRVGLVRVLTLAGLASAIQDIALAPIEGSDPCPDFWPAFSPDSHWIALRDHGSLAIYDVRGGRVTIHPAPLGRTVVHPSWAPDGSEIAIGAYASSGAVDIFAMSAGGYANPSRLTFSDLNDEPYYHYFKMPQPQLDSISPLAQAPGELLTIYGRGFDILHPQDNQVFFTDTLHTTWLPVEILSAAVDPQKGLGVLTVRVPPLAGHGALRVQTRFGQFTGLSFRVLPRPVTIVQPVSVTGAKVRVFGTGFDLFSFAQYSVGFQDGGGGWKWSPVLGGKVSAQQEFLEVVVPDGIAEQGAIRVQTGADQGQCACTFSLLHPRLTVRRTTIGLPSEVAQGCAGMKVSVSGLDFPYDPYYGYGVNNQDAIILVESRALAGGPPVHHSLGAALFDSAHGAYTATFALNADFPVLYGSAGGMVTVIAYSNPWPAARAEAPFRVPLINIPIIFVPGTSGNSLDITPPALPPLQILAPPPLPLPLPPPPPPLPPVLGDVHDNAPLCFACPPLVHVTKPYGYAGLDLFGPRVWMGMEFVDYALVEYLSEVVNGQILTNNVNHYLDILAFDRWGKNTLVPNRYVQPGTVFDRLSILGMEVYHAPIQFMTSPTYTLSTGDQMAGMNRPLCPSAIGPCTGGSGANGLYLFAYDWRGSLDTEAQRLSNFVDQVLNRPDVRAAGVNKVVMVTHSYGGPVARAYYMTGNNGAKVDQVVSMGGGFGGVPLVSKILEMGDNWGKGFSPGGALTIGFAEWEIKALAQNWPTAYFQQPNSANWFNDDSTSKPGSNFNRAFIVDERPGGPGEIHNLADSLNWLAQNHNPNVANDASNYFATHPWQGNFANYGTNGVYHQRIISKELQTIQGVKVRIDKSDQCKGALAVLADEAASIAAKLAAGPIALLECPGSVTRREPLKGDGDNTVPYHGALGNSLPADDHIFVTKKVEHSTILNDDSVLKLLDRMLRGETCSQVGSGFLSQSEAERSLVELSPADFSHVSSAQTIVAADLWWLSLRGPAQLDIRDAQGRHEGPTERLGYPGFYEHGIPGVSSAAGSSFSIASVTGTGVFTISLTGTSLAGLDLYLTGFSAGQQVDALAYINVPITRTGQAELVLDTEHPTLPMLKLDFAGDGHVQIITPTAQSPATSADTTSPTTTLTMQGNIVTLTAIDDPNGAGVLRTYYSTDAEPGFKVYEGSFSLPARATTLTAFSVDRNGNWESPGVTRSFGRRIFLPLVLR